MSWHKVTFSSSDITSRAMGELQDMCATRWMALGAPKDACILAPKGVEIDPPATWFLSPRMFTICEPLLRSTGAEKCDQPDMSSMGVVLANGSPADLFSA